MAEKEITIKHVISSETIPSGDDAGGEISF